MNLNYENNKFAMAKLIVNCATIKQWSQELNISLDTATKWRIRYYEEMGGVMTKDRMVREKKELVAGIKAKLELADKKIMVAYNKAEKPGECSKVTNDIFNSVKANIDFGTKMGILPKDAVEVTNKLDMSDILDQIRLSPERARKNRELIKNITKS